LKREGWFKIGVGSEAVPRLGALVRVGMMASRLNHDGRVIPALTDHSEDKGGVIGPALSARPSNIVNPSYGVARLRNSFGSLAILHRNLVTHGARERPAAMTYTFCKWPNCQRG